MVGQEALVHDDKTIHRGLHVCGKWDGSGSFPGTHLCVVSGLLKTGHKFDSFISVNCEILAAFSEAFCQPELHNEELRRKLAERNIDFAITKARSYREESNSKDVLTLDRQRVAESLHALSTLLGFEAADYFVFQDWDDFLEHMEMLEPKSFFHELRRR
jgi:tRNA A22 N-methylase